MNTWLRRLRGAVGMGLTWMVGWIPVGVLYGLTMSALGGVQVPLAAAVFIGAKLFGGLGFMAGGLFSLVLGITEGNHRFDQLKGSRFAMWGAVGGLLLGAIACLNGAGGPGFDLEDVFVLAFSTFLGTGSAAATFAIAREGGNRALAAADEELETLGLSEGEKHDLLSA